jgi:hypothetical protein
MTTNMITNTTINITTYTTTNTTTNPITNMEGGVAAGHDSKQMPCQCAVGHVVDHHSAREVNNEDNGHNRDGWITNTNLCDSYFSTQTHIPRATKILFCDL